MSCACLAQKIIVPGSHVQPVTNSDSMWPCFLQKRICTSIACTTSHLMWPFFLQKKICTGIVCTTSDPFSFKKYLYQFCMYNQWFNLTLWGKRFHHPRLPSATHTMYCANPQLHAATHLVLDLDSPSCHKKFEPSLSYLPVKNNYTLRLPQRHYEETQNKIPRGLW